MASRTFAVLFMVVWCGGWFGGAFSEYHKAGAGPTDRLVAVLMGVVGLGAAGFMLSQILRRGRPEVLRMYPDRVELSTGLPAVVFSYAHPEQARANRQQRQLTIPQANLRATLHLRETSVGNRLTVDLGHERLDLAGDATEVQREWLYGVLREHYPA